MTSTFLRSLIIVATWLLAAGAEGRGLRAAEGYAYYAAGHPEFRTCGNLVPGLALLGGPGPGFEGREPPPPEVDAAMTWLIRHGGYGHLVVLGASLADEYSTYIYQHLPPPHPVSVETLIFSTRQAAWDEFALQTIRRADALLIQGGDQWNYVQYWKGTPVAEAIRHLARKGAPLGGSSAGLAILGEFVFSAQEVGLLSPQALADPYDKHVTLERDFLELPQLGLAPYRFLRHVLTETHFSERRRLGRHLTCLARLVQDNWTPVATGLAVDEMTAVLIEADGSATVVDHRPPDSRGAAYFFVTPGRPEVCRAGAPLTYHNVAGYRIRASDAGASFNLATGIGTGGTRLSVSIRQGVLKEEAVGFESGVGTPSR